MILLEMYQKDIFFKKALFEGVTFMSACFSFHKVLFSITWKNKKLFPIHAFDFDHQKLWQTAVFFTFFTFHPRRDERMFTMRNEWKNSFNHIVMQWNKFSILLFFLRKHITKIGWKFRQSWHTFPYQHEVE